MSSWGTGRVHWGSIGGCPRGEVEMEDEGIVRELREAGEQDCEVGGIVWSAVRRQA